MYQAKYAIPLARFFGVEPEDIPQAYMEGAEMTEKKDGGFATSTEFFQAVIAAGDTTSSFQSVVECSQGGMTKDLRLQALEKPGEHDKWNQVEQQLKFSTVEADQEEYKRQLD